MPELLLPTTRLHVAFLDCRKDWGPGLHEDGFGLNLEDDVDSPDGFAAWVHERVRLTHLAGAPLPEHGSPRWIVEDGQVLGAIALRHYFDDRIDHIGYGIRPSARRRGLASWALGEMLVEARIALGLERVLVPCLANNVASARTIERNGGILKGIRDTETVRCGATGSLWIVDSDSRHRPCEWLFWRRRRASPGRPRVASPRRF
jgi:predicted acetyltransferase